MAENLKVKVTVDTKEAERSLASLTGVVSGLLGALAGREIIQFADSITNLKNKLGSVITSAQGVAAAFDAINKISMLTYQNSAIVGDLFVKIARNADGLGISIRDSAVATSQIAKALTVFGASGIEAERAVYNIGQAFALGRFQGEDLNAVIETMGPLAQEMAKVMGVDSVGALKKLAEQGKVTSDVLLNALANSADDINEKFKTFSPTISQALTNLGTASKMAFNEIEKNSQFGKTTGAAIEYLAFMMYKLSKNIDAVIGPLATIFKVGMALLAFTVVGKVMRGIAIVFGEITTAGATLGRLLMQLPKTFAVIGGYIKRIFFPVVNPKNTIFAGLWKSASQYLAPIIAIVARVGAAIGAFLGIDKLVADFKSLNDPTSKANQELQDFRAELGNFGQGLDDTKGSGAALAESQAEVARKVGAARKEIELSAEAYHRNVAAIKEQIQFQRDQIGVTEEQQKVNEAVRDFMKSYADEERRMQEEIVKLRAKGKSATDEEKGQISELQIQLDRLRASRDSDLASIRAATQALYAETQAYEINKAAKQSVMDIAAGGTDFRRQLEQQRALNMAENDLVKKKLEMQFEMEKANQQALLDLRKKYVGQEIPAVELAALEQIRAARQTELELNYKAFEDDFNSRRTFLAGWTEASQQAINQIQETVANQGAYAKRIFDTITGGFTNSIMKFVETGKLSFKDLFKSLMTEIIKMQMNKLFLSIFGKGGPMGSLFAGLFAEGGRIPGGKYGIVGERGPELVSGPANVIGTDQTAALMGGGGITQVTYNISAVDSRSFKDLVASDPAFIYNVTRAGARRIPR